MSELNDFFKLMAEGKKTDPAAVRSKEIKENIKSDLGGLFSQMAEMKKEDPLYQKNKKLEQQVHEAVKSDISSLFAELAALKNKKEELIAENPELVDTPIQESVEEIAEEVLIEVAPLNTPIGNIPVVQQLEPESNPVPAPVPNTSQYDIDLINKKIKFIEQWVGKIQNAGPGSGEVNLRHLDDVDRSTIGDGKYLNYNANTKKFQFSTLSGGGVTQVQSDWNQTDNTAVDYIENKPTLFSGDYDDLTNKPSTINWTNPSPSPSTLWRTSFSANSTNATISLHEGLPGLGSIYTWAFDKTKITFPDSTQQTTAWTGTYSYNNLTDKPTLFSGSYTDLTDKPTIPSLSGYATETFVNTAITNLIGAAPSALDTLKEIADQLAADESAVSSLTTTVAGKVSLSGSYADPTWITSLAYSKLTGAPTIPTVPTTVSSFTNDSGYLTSVSWSQVSGKPTFATVATSGSYTDLTNKPTIPTVPTNISAFTNDSGYLTSAAAGSLTGTTLNSTVVSSSLTSVGTLSSLNVTNNIASASGSVTANAATAFIAGAAAESGVALQMPREGALRDMTNGASTMYFDVSNGGTTHGNFNFRSSSNFTSLLHLSSVKATINPAMEVNAQTPYVGRTSFNAALDTVVTVDNLKYRISNQGGVFPQIASASGSQVDVCYDVEGIINGTTNPTYANNSGYLLAANGTWLSIYSSHGMDSRSDRLTAHITDKAAGRIYRATFMRTNNSSNVDGYNIVVERII